MDANKLSKIKDYLLILGGLVIADLIFAIGVEWLSLEIKENDFSAGPQNYNIVAHPFRSYSINPTDEKLWVNELHTISGKTYDFSLLETGTTINFYGHQTSPTSKDLHLKEKKQNEIRLFFVGGSTTYQPWPHLLGEKLNEKFKGYEFEIINAGAGGYTSVENTIDVVTTASAYEPDVIVAYLPINDIYWALAYDNDFLAEDFSHMRKSLTWHGVSSAPKHTSWQLPYPFSISYFLKFYKNSKLTEFYEKHSLRHNVLVDGWSFDPTRITDEKIKILYEILKRNIKTMHSYCHNNNCEFILLTQKIFKIGAWQESKYRQIAVNFGEMLENELGPQMLVINLQKIFPDNWNSFDMSYVREWYQSKNKNIASSFHEYLSYDDMHFSPEALVLLAKTLEDELTVKSQKISSLIK